MITRYVTEPIVDVGTGKLVTSVIALGGVVVDGAGVDAIVRYVGRCRGWSGSR